MINTNANKSENKKIVLKREVFFLTSSLLRDVGFSSRVDYLFFLRRFRQPLFLSNNTKSLSLKLKMSKFLFKSANNSSKLTGFYRAV